MKTVLDVLFNLISSITRPNALFCSNKSVRVDPNTVCNTKTTHMQPVTPCSTDASSNTNDLVNSNDASLQLRSGIDKSQKDSAKRQDLVGPGSTDVPFIIFPAQLAEPPVIFVCQHLSRETSSNDHTRCENLEPLDRFPPPQRSSTSSGETKSRQHKFSATSFQELGPSGLVVLDAPQPASSSPVERKDRETLSRAHEGSGVSKTNNLGEGFNVNVDDNGTQLGGALPAIETCRQENLCLCCCLPVLRCLFFATCRCGGDHECSEDCVQGVGNFAKSDNNWSLATGHDRRWRGEEIRREVSVDSCTESSESSQESEYSGKIVFSEIFYIGSKIDVSVDKDEVSSLPENSNLSPYWKSSDFRNCKSEDFRNSLPFWKSPSIASENFLTSFSKPRNSCSFDNSLRRNESCSPFNFSLSSAKLRPISTDLSLRKFFDGWRSENDLHKSNTDCDDFEESVVHSGLFNVLEESDSSRYKDVTRNNIDTFLWDRFARNVSFNGRSCKRSVSERDDGMCKTHRRRDCTQLRRHSSNLLPLPESSPYFTGGRLDPSLRNFKAPTWRLWGEEKVEGAIYTVYLKKVRYHHPSRSITQEADDDDISHLEWETVRVWFLKAGTLEKLVESLSSSETGELESTFVNVFLATFRTFSSVPQVLNLIIERYLVLLDTNNNENNVPEHLREEHQKALRLTLQVWLDTYPEDFRTPPHYSALQQLKQFTSEHLKDTDLDVKVQYKLDKMTREDRERESRLSGVVSCDDVILQCGEGEVDTNGRLTGGTYHPHPPAFPSLGAIPAYLAASQLTRMDMILFRNVVAHQCLGSIWGRRDRPPKHGTGGGGGSTRGGEAASVTATVDQFNAVSFRVQSTVLLNTDLKPAERAKLVVKWIDIAQELRILKNFSSLKAIISGLQSNPIYRLKKTWAAVHKEKCEVYEELARIFSEENNRLNQRELLIREGTAKHAQTAHTSDRHLPRAIEKHANNPLAVNHGTIPYLGTFLTDLMMIDTAIPDTVQDGLVNFDKKRKEFEVLAQIRLLQGAAGAYQIEPDVQFEQWWDSVLVLDDKESWRLSCLIESYEPANQTASAGREQRMRKRAAGLGHRKNDSLASTSSGSSASQFFLDTDSLANTVPDGPAPAMARKMSTSSTNSSQPSLDASLHSTATTASVTTLDRATLDPSANSLPSSPGLIPHEDDLNSPAIPNSLTTHNSLSNTSITSNTSNTSLSNVSVASLSNKSINAQNSLSNSSSGHLSLNASTSCKSNTSSSNEASKNGSSHAALANPYITPEFYIIKVSLESSAQETEGVNLYKSVLVSNSERTISVVRAAMEKHGIDEPADDYTLAQLLPHGEMILPASANVYYAISTAHDLNFVLRRRRHGDENTVIRRHPDKESRGRKKLPA